MVVSDRRFKPYPAYKDSGVEWLGQIPDHWEVTRTKFAARLRSGHTPSRQHPEYWVDCTIPWFGLADVWQIRDGQVEYVTETAEKISELGLANSAARLLPKGTVILSRTASVGFSAIMGVDMATTQDFVNWVCGPTLRPEYLLFGFRSMQHEFRRLTMGSTHQTIYMPDVARFSVAIPPLSEQDRIVAYVREERSRIDALVAKKERLIELLEENCTALITRAVTKGLDPNVPTKSSDVEWFGEVPAHWGMGSLSRWWQVVDCKHRTVAFLDEGIPLVSIGEVQSLEVDLSAAKRTSVEEYWQMISGGRAPRRGDIVYSRNATVGAAALVATDELFCMGQDVSLIRAADQDQRYLVFLLRSPAVMSQLDSAMVGSTFNRINVGKIKRLVVCVPPIEEQRAIAEFCRQEHRNTERLIGKVREAIDRLKELRTALISAAVTGKADLRDVSA